MPNRKTSQWIPPGGLVAGHLAHGLSWLVLLWLAVTPGASLWVGLGWLHLVALGWLTLVALAVLVHVIPGFTGIAWHWEGLARNALGAYALGVAALVSAFLAGAPQALPAAGAVVVVALACYLVPAFATLLRYRPQEKRERAIARALAITLAMLTATVVFGFLLALAVGAGILPAILAGGPLIHASLGIVGWFTLLTTGVSTRTIFPIARTRSRWPVVHIVVGSLLLLGTLALAFGFAFLPFLVDIGLIFTGIAIALYAADILDVLRRAQNPHRPPQAFVLAAIVWLILAFVVGVIALGERPQLAFLFAYLALVGWIGQMVNGHLHHIGVRVIATAVRGEDDETRPVELLSAPLSWSAFAASQAAVALGSVSLAYDVRSLLAFAAFLGFAGFAAMSANMRAALRAAARVPVNVIER